MGKKKNPTRNSFFFFMLDFKEKSSTKFASMQDVSEAANPHWQKLTPEQRKPYEERALAEKHQQKVVKYTTTGVSIEVMQKREDEHMAKVQGMKDDIANIIHGAIEGRCLAEQPFHLIHLNHYGFCNTNRQYIPAEIAVARFTLKDGVTSENVFHSIIKPGPLPLGYAFQAMKVSKESHLIEPKLGDDAETNVDQVTIDFMTFMMEFNKRKGSVPPVYVREKNKDAVENVLKNFCLNSGYEEDFIKVYSLEYFFFVLRNAVGDQLQPVYPSISVCKMELEKDKYDFCKDIPCSYHAISDVPYHCSRSNAMRIAYIICDNCCADLQIDLIAGQHVPAEAKIVSSKYQSVASGYSTTSLQFPTVKEAPHTKKPSHHNSPADEYFLSQRTESEMSTMSQTSSACDPNEYTARGRYAYDSEYSQVDTEGWIEPKQKHKRNQNKPLSQTSTNSNAATAELNFTSPSGDDCNRPTTSRRPTTLSAALLGGISQLSLSQSSEFSTSRNIVPVGRGRGRGIAANFANKK